MMNNSNWAPWMRLMLDRLDGRQPQSTRTRATVSSSSGLGLLVLVSSLAGCAAVAARPELSPDSWAPPTVMNEWIPSRALARQYAVQNTQAPRVSALAQPPPIYDLTGLIDIALRNNPATRRQWQVARSAAAQFGAAQAPFYPQFDVQSANGYQRTIIELPGTAGKLKQWQAQPVAELTYVLLDFGRRRSMAEAARNRLIASN